MPEHIKKKLEDEIKQLEYQLTSELPAEIKKARAMGDLSENAEYHMAKQRQEFVNARLGQLEKRMAELSLVNFANIPRDKPAGDRPADIADGIFRKAVKLTVTILFPRRHDVQAENGSAHGGSEDQLDVQVINECHECVFIGRVVVDERTNTIFFW